MNEFDLSGMSQSELTDLLEDVMICLRQLDAEQIKRDFVIKSQRLRIEAAKKHLGRDQVESPQHSTVLEDRCAIR